MGTHHRNSLLGGTLGNQRTLIYSSARGLLHTSFHFLSATHSNVSSRLNFCWLDEGFSGWIDSNFSRWIHHERALGSEFKCACWCVLYFAGSVF